MHSDIRCCTLEAIITACLLPANCCSKLHRTLRAGIQKQARPGKIFAVCWSLEGKVASGLRSSCRCITLDDDGNAWVGSEAGNVKKIELVKLKQPTGGLSKWLEVKLVLKWSPDASLISSPAQSSKATSTDSRSSRAQSFAVARLSAPPIPRSDVPLQRPLARVKACRGSVYRCACKALNQSAQTPCCTDPVCCIHHVCSICAELVRGWYGCSMLISIAC